MTLTKWRGRFATFATAGAVALALVAAPAAASASNAAPVVQVVDASGWGATLLMETAGFHYPAYCVEEEAPDPCLEMMGVIIVNNGCLVTGGGSADLRFKNPNSADAPRTIKVFRDGPLVFQDDGWAGPGTTILEYRNMQKGVYRIVVRWGPDIVMAKKRLDFTGCPDLPPPPPPPVN